MQTMRNDDWNVLLEILDLYGDLGIAVSGGVDSMVLAHAAHHRDAAGTRMFHAVSPAVPLGATNRVKRHARQNGWKLTVIDAGEQADSRYRGNPVNRCYFCKSNLYQTIRRNTSAVVASGTNRDDLDDFRPGLDAAAENGVVHPYVEAGFTKARVRRLARFLGLDDLADLPAQPCLASRIRTGVSIKAADLGLVEAVEDLVAGELGAGNIRCRIGPDGVRLELPAAFLAAMVTRRRLETEVRDLCNGAGQMYLGCAPYRRGSAFVAGGSKG
jgi:uncharacterized protein